MARKEGSLGGEMRMRIKEHCATKSNKTKRNYTKGKQLARFFAALFEDGRAEPYRKFGDFKAQRLACQKMPELVYGYHNKQDKHGKQYAA